MRDEQQSGRSDRDCHRGVARGIAGAAALSVALILALLASVNAGATARPWAWILTGLQVIAMWTAGSGRSSGWLIGAGVQPAWTLYAIVTNHEGFVVGRIVSGCVQLSNFCRSRAPSPLAIGCSDERSW